MRIAVSCNTRLSERSSIFANVTRFVVVEELAEETHDPRLAYRRIFKHPLNFAADIFSRSHSPFGYRLFQGFIGRDVAECVIDCETQLPVLKHYSAMFIRCSMKNEFGTEECIAIQKDGRKTQ